MTDSVRWRLLAATFAEVEANGLRGLTIEAVATRAGSSRATIYRQFPGGRDELVLATIEREVALFFAAITADSPDPHDVLGYVATLLTGAHRLLGEHAVLQRLLQDEADALLPSLATVQPLVHRALADHLGVVLAEVPLRPGVPLAEVADHGARMVLSYVGTEGSWDLTDADAVAEVVRDFILPGVDFGA